MARGAEPQGLERQELLAERLGPIQGWQSRLNINHMAAVLPLVDALCLALGFWLAYLLRFESAWWPYYGLFSAYFYRLLALWIIVGWVGLFGLYRLYDPEILFGGVEEYARLMNACVLGTLLVAFYSFLSRDGEGIVSRGWLFSAAGLAGLSTLIARLIYRRFIYRLRRQGLLQWRTLVVGINGEGREILRQIDSTPTEGYRIVGFVDNEVRAGQVIDGVPVLGRLAELRGIIAKHGVTHLIVSPTALGRERLLELYQTFGNDPEVRIQLSTGLYELYTTHARIKEVAFVPLVSLDRMRITGLNSALKSLLDYTVAAVGLLLLAPLLAGIALWVKHDSPGPVIYRRKVLGAGGRTFDAFKFRTMRVDGDQILAQHPELAAELRAHGKLKDDPRVTRVGRKLRRLSLDELPQLVNVLRGEMSLVGPRMITPAELERFGQWRHNLLTVKPGLTGLWQISGRSDVGYEERVRLDMNYIRNYTIWLDLHILINTVTAVLQGKGAY